MSFAFRELGISLSPRPPSIQELTSYQVQLRSQKIVAKLAGAMPVFKSVLFTPENSQADMDGIDVILTTKFADPKELNAQIKVSPIGCAKFFDKIYRKYGLMYQDVPLWLAHRRTLLIRADTEQNALACMYAQFARMNLPC